MQSLQRRMGRMHTRSADESEVAVILKTYDDVDKMLDSLIAASRSWRDAWKLILRQQQLVAAEFDTLYQSIAAGAEYGGPPPVETPDYIANRAMKMAKEYAELEADMIQEINEMDLRVLKPCEDAKASIQPLKKTTKKRQDRKLDYEGSRRRYDNSVKKIGRSEKENNALKKHEAELARCKEEYQTADDRIRQCFPPVLQNVFSLLPYILASQIIIQNNLLGHCYTQISEFSTQEGYPNPAPDFAAIAEVWEDDVRVTREQIEGLQILRKGKTVGTPLKQPVTESSPNHPRRPSYQSTPSFRSEVSPARSDISSVTAVSIPPSPNLSNKPTPNMSSKPKASMSPDYEHGRGRMLNVPSQTTLALSQPNYASPNAGLTPDTLSGLSPAGPKADYFTRDRLLSTGSQQSNVSAPSALTSLSTSPSALATAAAKKKRPPPPPKPKRINSAPAVFVTALYDFGGQGQGDLSFKEGDKIRVLKRTDSTQDWWEGELHGTKGSFPANYVQA